MAVAVTALNLLGATTAMLAAVFWFMSARNRLPRMLTYWDATPEEDPFYRAVQRGNRLNRTAAGFAAVSALCAAVIAVLPLLTANRSSPLVPPTAAPSHVASPAP